VNPSLRPIDGPAAWRGSSLARSDEWIYRLGAAEIADIDRVVAAVLSYLVVPRTTSEYALAMDRAAIREFVARNRERVAALKREHHAQQYRTSHGTAGLEAGRWLREYARRVRPDWPTERDRDEDLAHHVALKQRIDRAAHAFSAR
jgi:hypothetical protein